MYFWQEYREAIMKQLILLELYIKIIPWSFRLQQGIVLENTTATW